MSHLGEALNGEAMVSAVNPGVGRRRTQEAASVGQPSLGDAPRGSHRFGWLANSRGVQFTYFLNTEAK